MKQALYAEMRLNRSITGVATVHKFAYMNGYGLHKIGSQSRASKRRSPTCAMLNESLHACWLVCEH